MKDHFVFIAYKPNSDDYCRGSLMESYPSDFVYVEYDKLESLVQRMADIEEYDLGISEVSHSTWLIHNGVTIIKEDEVVKNEKLGYDLNFKVNAVLQERKQHREHEEQLLIEKQELEDKEQEIEQGVIVEQHERVQLQILAQKYPDELTKKE